MQQRFELRGHHQVDQEDRQAEREQQRLHRCVELLALPADVHADAGAERIARAPCRCTSRTAVPRSTSRRLAETIATRTWSARWISLGPVVATTSATESSVTGRLLPGLTIRRRMSSTEARSDSLRAHQHVDLAVAEAVARGDFAAHLASRPRSAIWRVVRPSARGAILVEADLDFREALLHRRLDVGEVRDCLRSIAARLLAGALRCASRSWPRSSISSGVEKLKSSGRLNSTCAPGCACHRRAQALGLVALRSPRCRHRPSRR